MHKVSFLASERHFIDHLLPIWNDLPKHVKDKFYVHKDAEIYAQYMKLDYTLYDHAIHNDFMLRKNIYGVVASWGDLRRLGKGNVQAIYLEHGAGQTYNARHNSYAGGKNRNNVILFLCPNKFVEKRNKEYYPDKATKIIGCPKLDVLHNKTFKINKKEPIIGVSFHWDCKICPETLSTYEYYKAAIIETDYNILGHSHPRLWEIAKKHYRQNNISRTQFFSEVLERCDVYCVDNSSSLFEFASLNKPVVVLNAPWYRREVEHGLRFWEFADIGVNCDAPEDLNEAIKEAVKDTARQRKRRMKIIDEVYPVRGNATQKAVEAIMDVI